MIKKLVLVAMLICIGCSKPSSESLKIMTYNIRLDIKTDGENQWSNRKDFLLSQIKFYEPTIFGTQEGRPNQIKYITEKLPNYAFIGHGRDGGNKGEYSAIFYDSTKVRFSNVHTFWLSETPNKKSLGWDASYPRICTYGLMNVLNSEKQIWVFNTHLDHQGALAQRNGMQLILQEIKKVNTKNYPVIITGDFNVTPDSDVISTLSLEYDDAKILAGENAFGTDGTFNGFKFHEPITRRIDYIFFSKNAKLSVSKYAVLTDSKDLKYPSDHFPVYAEIKLK